MALQPKATLSAKGNGVITGKSLPHYEFQAIVKDLIISNDRH